MNRKIQPLRYERATRRKTKRFFRKARPSPDKSITGILVMDESDPGELLDPVRAGLFIEVPDASLAAIGGGHDEVIGVDGQGGEERIGEVGVDVFRNFEASYEVKRQSRSSAILRLCHSESLSASISKVE